MRDHQGSCRVKRGLCAVGNTPDAERSRLAALMRGVRERKKRGAVFDALCYPPPHSFGSSRLAGSVRECPRNSAITVPASSRTVTS